MVNRNSVYLAFLFIIATGCFGGQSLTDVKEVNGIQSFVGNWSGQLKVYKEGRVRQKLPMTLDVRRMDDESWTFVSTYYTPSDTLVKDYILRTWDATKGQYEMDERNGIILPTFLMDRRLVCVFGVAENNLYVSYSLYDENLYLDIDVVPNVSNIITGDTLILGDTIPPVTIFPVVSSQKAVLTKVK